MHQRQHELSLPIRASIIGYRVQMKLDWPEIGQQSGIYYKSAKLFFQRTLKRADGVDNALIYYLNTLNGLKGRAGLLRFNQAARKQIRSVQRN